VQLEVEGYTVTLAASGDEAEAILAWKPQDLVITDVHTPGISGVELLKHIRSEYPDTVVALIATFGTVETAVEAMKLGAYDYVTKPVNPDSLRIVVARALAHLSLREEVQTLRRTLGQRPGFQDIIGRSHALAYALDMAARAAQSDVAVLIRGESGTGKELMAHRIHYSSSRKGKPFVTINCGAIPKGLVESELFGHVKNAFTGAATHKKGKIETADGGTVFLNEIGELLPELQVKLLRLIQEREIEPVGETGRTEVDVRIIAATHRNLLEMAANGGFQEDLYCRLNVVALELPPLRDRAEDIPELIEHFFGIARDKQGRPNLKLPIALLSYFSAYRWPGNIRELENIIERLVVLASSAEITFEDLPEALRKHRPALDMLQIELPAHGISLEAVEKELITQALIRFNGNQTQAARYLDLSRKTLIYRMEKYGLRGAPDARDDLQIG
jgi:two-component system NtrC family response regulator